jgi:hypothetical protein
MSADLAANLSGTCPIIGFTAMYWSPFPLRFCWRQTLRSVAAFQTASASLLVS